MKMGCEKCGAMVKLKRIDKKTHYEFYCENCYKKIRKKE